MVAVSPAVGRDAASRTASCQEVVGERVEAGGEERVRTGRRIRGEVVEGERVAGAGQARVRGWLPGMRQDRERGREGREVAVGEGLVGRYGRGGRGRGAFPGGVCGVATAQLFEEFALAPAAQQQKDERVGVQETGHLVAEGGHMFAGPAVVGTGTAGVEIARGGQQSDTGLGRRVDQRVRHLLGEQRGKVTGAGGDSVQEHVPVGVGERPQTQLGAVGAGRLP